MNDAAKHSDLPLPDYDHVPVGMLPAQISALDEGAVSQLLDYERGHGDRLPVVQVLEHRLAALREGAEPSEGAPAPLPDVTGDSGGSKVSPATSGPPVNPPSHGVPTNPAQPR
jgi:hypothetical protein